MRKVFYASLLLVMCAVVQAGVISFNCTYDDDPYQFYHDWSFEAVGEGGVLTMAESYKWAYPASDSVNMFAAADADPIIKVTKYLTNDSGSVWTGFTLSLYKSYVGGIVFTGPPYPPYSDLFDTAVVSNAGTVITYSGGSVNIGEEVALNFNIFVLCAGNYSWTLTQQPIPEPATLIIFGIGGLALLRRK